MARCRSRWGWRRLERGGGRRDHAGLLELVRAKGPPRALEQGRAVVRDELWEDEQGLTGEPWEGIFSRLSNRVDVGEHGGSRDISFGLPMAKDAPENLQSDLKGLEDKLLEAYDLIDRAEWRSHKNSVAKLLPILKDLTYDAEDLLDEFRWYDMKVRVEGEAIQLSPFVEFFHSIVHGSFNKVTDIQKRIGNVSSLLERVGRLHELTPRFDKTLRPVTTSFRTERKIFGRQKELKEVIRLLGVPNHSSSSSAKRKRTSNAANNKLTISSVHVLPIVGIGGVGKTTLAQEITTNQRVKSHFDKIIWICVSDEFDEERFTKILIKSLSGREPTSDNLDDLQQHLVKNVGKKRFLLILDDIWPAGLEDGQRWKKFCVPLENVLQGSMLLVTTRFAEVADTVGTMKSFALEGLEDGVFWNFFKLCVFGAEDSEIDPELEQIGRSILPKLKGTPLAAKTIGRLLRKSLNTAHWNNILNNELWQIDQKETDILPALRLSYMYLPFHLKRCFSFCAVYPKDYNFDKDSLAEIWVAEGFVEPQGSIPLQHIGYGYFEDLVNLSFFQEHRGHYVIHDLMHDMAQLVSKEECFILKNESDLKNVPENVRHLLILKSSIKSSGLRILCKYKKLRTLLCDKGLMGNTPDSMIEQWFSELRSLRVIRCASIKELPESIRNLKHLRQCEFEILPSGFSKLISLQKFESTVRGMEVDAAKWEEGIRCSEHNEIEVCQALHPPVSVKSVHLDGYPGKHLPSWFPGSSGPEDMSFPDIPAVTVDNNNGAVFSSLTEKLETLDDLLTQEYLPAIKKISFVDCCLQDLTSLETLDMRSCKGIVSVPGDLWGNLKSLQTLMIRNFPDLVSIGGPTAIANINEVLIDHCWKLKEIEQPLRRGFR
ncbi:putative disease resistance protein RGA4 [Sorghum bicolor]|uniref:putative disease resistance protein RGA4 n=1 Tax=Sorghum bicolor TaxID=4558 RepID=UPI000B4246D0|nr:putative disease resistance protein RGA4 [Sorghum bicolor]|eukprot:XP_021321802.1 putative disease resistance protein RGA4 [Sorghum bicolor]